MKKYLFLFLCATLVFQSCQDDEVVIPTPSNVLNYDGPNFSAPSLPQGIYEAAVRFEAEEVADFQGKKLKEVEVYFVSVPASPQIKVYAQGTGGTPGNVLHTGSLAPSDTSPNSWTRYTIPNPIDIPAEGLWISVRVDHPNDFGSVGCDEGRADANGDLFFVNADNVWMTLREYTNGEADINWNIRGITGE